LAGARAAIGRRDTAVSVPAAANDRPGGSAARISRAASAGGPVVRCATGRAPCRGAIRWDASSRPSSTSAPQRTRAGRRKEPKESIVVSQQSSVNSRQSTVVSQQSSLNSRQSSVSSRCAALEVWYTGRHSKVTPVSGLMTDD
jgi:hypothetical protein